MSVTAPNSKQKPTLILVDDEEGVTDILEAYLEDHFEVTSFNDSLRALENLQQSSYDLMITDIRMPKMDGMKLLIETKKIHPKMNIIQCTGHAISKEEIKDGVNKGASGVMIKPFGSPDDVLSFINSTVPGVLKSDKTQHEVAPVQNIATKSEVKQENNAANLDGLPKVLIIDDDEDVAEVLAALIESDFDTTIITDETQAISTIQENDFDIIITDLNMPQISGSELIEQINSIQSKARVIVSTGHDRTDPAVVEALNLGACDILTKPFANPDDLLSTLNRVQHLKMSS